MRIGTWNLGGLWSEARREFLLALDCDVLLLTEVDERVVLPGYGRHLTTGLMAARRRWAGVLSRLDLSPLPDPHPASALASVDGAIFCSSILPWKGAGNREPWIGSTHAERTEATLKSLLQHLPRSNLVWGGDWNHALSGPEYAGGKAGRLHLMEALDSLNLKVPTATLAHRIDGLLTIDQIALGPDQHVDATARHRAVAGAGRLSDHDAYTVELS